MIDEHADDDVGHFGRVGRLDHDAGFAREVFVAGDAADQETKPNPGRDLAAGFDLDRLEADVVRILEHGNDPAAIEPDVEFARQTVERTLVENVKMPLARVRGGIDQLLRINARRGRARHVADIVGTGAAGAQPEILDGLDHEHGVLRLDLADLEIGARGHVGIAAAIALGEIGDPCELPMRENAVRHAQAAHI